MNKKSKKYKVIQIVLKEKMLSVNSGNLDALERHLNDWYEQGYELDKFSTTETNSKGLAGGDRILATCILKRIN